MAITPFAAIRNSFRFRSYAPLVFAAFAAVLIFVPFETAVAAQSRDQNVAEIVKLVDVQNLIEKTQIENLQKFQSRMEQMRAQLNPYLSSMSPEDRQKFDAAIDKCISTVTIGYDPAIAAAAWGKAFASHFTDQELAKVVELSHTPIGGKLLKANVAASSQWNSDIRKARNEISEAAYDQLLVEVKPILDDAARRLQPTTVN